LICDEAHYVKGRKTWWTSTVRQLGDRADQVILPTGTPLVNWAHEAFTLLQMMYPEKTKAGAELGSYWRWVRDWFQVGSHWSEFDIGQILDNSDAGWERWRRENWGDRMILRRREECLDLPPLTVQQIRVKLAPPQRRVYKDLQRDFFAWIDEQAGEHIAMWSTASQVTKLAQAATGLEVLDPRWDKAPQNSKLKVLQDLLADRPRQTLVVAHFQKSVEAAARAAGRAGKTAMVLHGGTPKSQRGPIVRAFQRGEIDVLCAGIGVVSEGLTLHQAGCDQIIRLERSWLPGKNEQVLRRLHRIGVERPVLCIDLVAINTMDENVLEVVARKTDQQMRGLGARDLRKLAA
jgi:hypothetical protein